jgi:DNA-binding HxlR family transcriptional regulator
MAAFAARCLHVVSDLAVADHIGDQPVRIGELASSCGVDPDGLDRVLRLLTTHGIFQRQQGSYGHTPSSLLPAQRSSHDNARLRPNDGRAIHVGAA